MFCLSAALFVLPLLLCGELSASDNDWVTIRNFKDQMLSKCSLSVRNGVQEQTKRRTTLENLLANWNEGRSASFYCIASALMPIDSIKKALTELAK